MSEEGRQKIINDVKYLFGLIGIEIKKAILPWYTDSRAARDKAELDADKAVFDASADAAKTKIGLIAAEKELQEQAKEDKENVHAEGRKLALAEIDRQKKQIDAVAKKSAADKDEIVARKKAEDAKPIDGWGGAAAGAASLGASGALIGSIIPGVGTAIGGAIGVALGGIAGSLGLIEYGSKAPEPGLTKSTNTSAEAEKSAAANAAKSTTPKTEKSLVDHAETLNKHNAEMLKHQKEQTDYTKKSYEAIKALNKNVWA